MNSLSTRDKILSVCYRLSADKGLNGVSVREIAKECDVNVAAINYHFSSKENLYLETIAQILTEAEADIHNIYDSLEIKKTEDFAIKVFEHFLENSESLRTSFKLIISTEKYHEALGDDIDRFKGPPGGEYFYRCLAYEIPEASEEDLQWGVRVLFTHVIHKAIIMCNHSTCTSMQNLGLTDNLLREDIYRLIRIVKAEITPQKK